MLDALSPLNHTLMRKQFYKLKSSLIIVVQIFRLSLCIVCFTLLYVKSPCSNVKLILKVKFSLISSQWEPVTALVAH